MIKIQIAAKAIWNGLVLSSLGSILGFFYLITAKNTLNAISSTTLFGGICTCLILLIWALHNISLPLRLTGTTVVIAEPSWQKFFIQTNRLACIFVGLILLSGSYKIWSLAITSIIHLFPAIRDWITLWFEGNWNAALKETGTAVVYLFCPFGYLFFCGYLIFGANGFIRRQVNLFEKYIIRESCNE